jgi:hypothetical protein
LFGGLVVPAGTPEIIVQAWPLKITARGKDAVKLMATPAMALLYAKAFYFLSLGATIVAVFCK